MSTGITDDTLETYVTLGEEGNVIAVYEDYDSALADACDDERVKSLGVVSCMITDYDEICTLGAAPEQSRA